MATLFFIAIYLYLFEIFIQRTKISESETMKKAKILFIFTLSIFSAIAIGYAIPFLFNLYGFILLILLLIALFFFGRAAISYGKSFHHSIKSFAANAEKDLVKAEGELKEARKNLSEQEARYLIEGIEKVHNDLENVMAKFNSAEIKFNNILSDLMHAYSSFINSLIKDYNSYLNRHKRSLQPTQIKELDKFIKSLGNKRRDSLNSDNQHIPSIKKLYNDISRKINILTLDNKYKLELQKILDSNYNNIIHSQISKIQEAINEYNNVRISLMKFHQYEDAFKRDISLRFRQILLAPDSRKYEIGILSALDKSKSEIERIENLVNERIQFLESLLH
jgi:F0F1-type ATP synthase membrane subunit b/b'